MSPSSWKTRQGLLALTARVRMLQTPLKNVHACMFRFSGRACVCCVGRCKMTQANALKLDLEKQKKKSNLRMKRENERKNDIKEKKSCLYPLAAFALKDKVEKNEALNKKK